MIFDRRMAASLLYFAEMTFYVTAIFIAGKMSGLTKISFMWIARIVIDTLIIAVMSLHLARRHHAHA
jgi:hypothetical protein